uniref:Facilitated trehalose transporter Tret1 n=2 Tax=Lygus hesperus TaxID=30085 RepID=A0A146LSN9_LYGHE
MKYETKATLRQYAAAIIANVAAFCIGNMLGWSSPVQPILESEDSPLGEPLTRQQFSWLSSINFLGGVAGTLFWGRLSDRIGRKYTGLTVAVPFAVGWSLILAANNQWMLYTGRFFIGMACSGTVINTPMYVTEIAQDKIRGALGSFLMINLNLGTLFSFIVGASTSYYFLTSTCLGIVMLYFLGLLTMPDSPASLLVKKKRAEALESMCWYRGGDQVQAEKDLTLVESRLIKPRRSYASIFETRGRIKGFIIGVGFILGQQACGMLAVTIYAVTIFKEAGSSLTPHQSAIVLGCLQVVSSICSLVLVDKLGRKVLLVTSFTAMGVSLCSLGVYYYLKASIGQQYLFIPVVALSVHLVAYSVGAGPVPFIVLSELFAPDIRGTAISLIQFIGIGLSFVTVKIFPWMNSQLGPTITFSSFGLASLLLPLFIIFVVPETSGRTLNSIVRELEGEKQDGEEMIEVTRIQPQILPSSLINPKQDLQPKQ